jgi:hypothetical protein
MTFSRAWMFWLDCANSRQVTHAGLAHLGGLAALEELAVGRTSVTGTGLYHLKALRRLRKLDLWSAQSLAEAGLASIGALTALRSLDLGRSSVTDSGLANLRPLTGLESLHLEKTKVGNTGLSHVRGLTKLHRLILNETQVADARRSGRNSVLTLMRRRRTVQWQRSSERREGSNLARTHPVIPSNGSTY